MIFLHFSRFGCLLDSFSVWKCQLISRATTPWSATGKSSSGMGRWIGSSADLMSSLSA
jgi:hypothetical protein